jgi:hypothetical protein
MCVWLACSVNRKDNRGKYFEQDCPFEDRFPLNRATGCNRMVEWWTYGQFDGNVVMVCLTRPNSWR